MIRTLLQLMTGGAVVVVLSSCGQAPSSPPDSAAGSPTNVQIHVTRGVVKELKPDGRTIVIRHEEITNYMPAMTMPFEVRNTRELEGLKSNDVVTFRMLVTDKDGWIDQLAKVGVAAAEPPRANETFRRVREVEPLNVGDPVPDYPFTNELGQAISLGQFKGSALGLTFIFTRCPFPTFCPRMSVNFDEASQKLAALKDVNWRLLSVSFDPEFDTPEVLKAYARRYNYNPERWSFVTGAMIEIDALTEQFGLLFPRNQSGFDHNLRTVVIDAQGRVQKVFVGNEWKVEDFVEEMIKAAQAK